ncbi:acetyl-CoA carboxylase biotin carboxyl carrier protein subunit [Tenuifilaceae bacterium CYCD]|nr:acetyl-CoA carboxylase biotin carboxyl carrier protein subunit [Tenuifilaceae bacterium CYCD]
MGYEVKIGDRIASVKLIKREGQFATVEIDGVQYDIDIAMVENGVYSILHEGKSYNIEIIPGDGPKNYFVNTFYNSHEVEIIDAQSRYLMSRKSTDDHSADKIISTPMPGRVVKIPVSEGVSVTKGTTVITISAMKMESEYKSSVDGVVKKIHVAEGDNINANQPLIEIE